VNPISQLFSLAAEKRNLHLDDGWFDLAVVSINKSDSDKIRTAISQLALSEIPESLR
jgi:hypothetical protein